jgi:hypothetical protein
MLSVNRKYFFISKKDVHGREHLADNVISKEFTVDIRHLAAAPYYFTFVADNYEVYHVKIVKR